MKADDEAPLEVMGGGDLKQRDERCEGQGEQRRGDKVS